MVQNALLIWSDSNIDNENVDCHHVVTQLRSTINTIETFTDPDDCVNILTNISGTLCQQLVPLIHSVSHLQSVLLLSEKKKQFGSKLAMHNKKRTEFVK